MRALQGFPPEKLCEEAGFRGKKVIAVSSEREGDDGGCVYFLKEKKRKQVCSFAQSE